jgi:DNA polymerase-3 subunit beta
MDPDEFRGLEGEREGTCLVLKSEVFRTAVERCAVAVAREASKFAFNGILVEITEAGKVFMVGSDGRRLSVVELEPEEKPESKVYSLVPKRSFTDFLRVLPPAGEPVRIHFSRTRMHLDLGNTTVFAQIIDGEYPDYLQVVPQEAKNKVTIPVRPLEEALRRIMFVSSNESPIAKLIFYSHGELEIQSVYGDKAGKESLEVELEGEGGEISFNPQYVVDYLKVCGRETVHLHFSDNQIPGKFDDGGGFLHVVMPVSL